MRALIFVLLLAGQAQAADRRTQRACQADYVRLCAGATVTGPAATACLRQSYLSLSRGCRAALGAAKKAEATAVTPRGRTPE